MKKISNKTKLDLLKRPGVRSVGRGFNIVGGVQKDEEVITVGVVKKIPPKQLPAGEIVPDEIDNEKTDVVKVGPIRALGEPAELAVRNTDWYRPLEGGCSIGHYAISAGTFGCVVKRNGIRMILSNNHVLADSNDANIGDAILQPGPHDGGALNDQVATLHQYIPIEFIGQEISDCLFSRATAKTLNAMWATPGKVGMRPRLTRFQAIVPQGAQDVTNLVDAALAMPLGNIEMSDHIIDIGPISGTVEPELGTRVKKSGRTTEYTIGTITQVDVTTQVSYGGLRVAIFEDQIMVTSSPPFSAGGDSGSAVLDLGNRICGLLFAGSEEVTIVNRWANVERLLGVTV